MKSPATTVCAALPACLLLAGCFGDIARKAAQPYVDAFNRHDVAAMTNHAYSESVVFVDPNGHRLVGREAMRDYLEALFGHVSDLRVELTDVQSTYSDIVADWRVRASGRVTTLHTVDVVRDGAYVETTWTSPSPELFDVGAAQPAGAAKAPAPSSSPPVPAFVAAAPQPGAFALVVGIERYRDVPAATGARADAERFAQVARQTLGLREEHLRVETEDHATRTDILGGLKWLRESASAGSRVYFFFSGHGAPSPDASTYLLPYDGNPKDIAGSAVAMSEVMDSLGQTRAKEVLAVVDACFSGAGGRSVLPAGARPLMRVKDPSPTPQMALFTASQGDEISGPAPGENAGVFSKYVTTGLGTGAADVNGDGQISLQELSDWVAPRVARTAKQDNREQHPKLVMGTGAGDPGNFIVEYGLATK